MAHMPPKGVKHDFKDFINYCKYQLCHFTRTLYLDPVWDTYSDEAIISEYFALTFTRDTDKKEEFESLASGVEPDFLSWVDSEIEKNKEVLEKKLSENEISFSSENFLGND